MVRIVCWNTSRKKEPWRVLRAMDAGRGIRAVRGVSRFRLASMATVVLAFSVGTATGPTVSRPATLGEPDSAADFQVRIEGVQRPSRQGLDVLTIEEVMERFGVPGMSVAVIRDFQVHWAKGYGIADVETGMPVDDETLFQAASISKPVTAMAALAAVEDGRFSLDDDINAILTSWRLPGNGFTDVRPVTPRLLFSHTAGLGDGHGFPGYEPDAPRPTPVQILQGDAPSNVGPVTMVRTPLTAMHYSGGGTTIMQLALTDVFGEPFPEIMRTSVLEPAGMTHSTFLQPLPPALDENAARGHGGDGQPMGDAKWHVYSALAAAGLWTNARDLARFAIEVQRSARGDPGRVLTASSAAEMLSPVGVGPFAVGFLVDHVGEGWYFSHSGGNWGFVCNLIAHKAKGYGLAVMTTLPAAGRWPRRCWNGCSARTGGTRWTSPYCDRRQPRRETGGGREECNAPAGARQGGPAAHPRGNRKEGRGQSALGQSTPWCGVRIGPSPL